MYFYLFVAFLFSMALAFPADSSVSKNDNFAIKFLGTADGKSYFYDRNFTSGKGKTWLEASKICTDVGLRLASINTPNQLEVFRSYRYDPEGFYFAFWLSGRDSNAFRQFTWNDTNTEVSSSVLGSVPLRNTLGSYQSCLTINKQGDGSIEFLIFECLSTWPNTLCEST